MGVWGGICMCMCMCVCFVVCAALPCSDLIGCMMDSLADAEARSDGVDDVGVAPEPVGDAVARRGVEATGRRRGWLHAWVYVFVYVRTIRQSGEVS